MVSKKKKSYSVTTTTKKCFFMNSPPRQFIHKKYHHYTPQSDIVHYLFVRSVTIVFMEWKYHQNNTWKNMQKNVENFSKMKKKKKTYINLLTMPY